MQTLALFADEDLPLFLRRGHEVCLELVDQADQLVSHGLLVVRDEELGDRFHLLMEQLNDVVAEEVAHEALLQALPEVVD